jgi:hypothetical protein
MPICCASAKELPLLNLSRFLASDVWRIIEHFLLSLEALQISDLRNRQILEQVSDPRTGIGDATRLALRAVRPVSPGDEE